MDTPRTQTDVQSVLGADSSNILLQDILTDSDEDEEIAYPSWTNSPEVHKHVRYTESVPFSEIMPTGSHRVSDYIDYSRGSSVEKDKVSSKAASPDPHWQLPPEYAAAWAARLRGRIDDASQVVRFLLDGGGWEKLVKGNFLLQLRGINLTETYVRYARRRLNVSLLQKLFDNVQLPPEIVSVRSQPTHLTVK
jgi:hypothetical protein